MIDGFHIDDPNGMRPHLERRSRPVGRDGMQRSAAKSAVEGTVLHVTCQPSSTSRSFDTMPHLDIGRPRRAIGETQYRAWGASQRREA